MFISVVATGDTHENDELALCHSEVDALEDGKLTVPHEVALPDVLENDHFLGPALFCGLFAAGAMDGTTTCCPSVSPDIISV